MNKHIIILILLFPSVVFAYSKSGTTYTTDGSYSDVNSALTDASEGDTINIPSGSFSWTSQLSITKSINLIGAGKASTTITHGYSGDLIYLNPGSDKAIRISGIFFTQSTNYNGYSTIRINGNTAGSYALTQIRIDNCKIEKGTQAVYSVGRVEGVIDNNEFLNNNISVLIIGDDGEAWDVDTVSVTGGKTYNAGGSHSLFIEDNTFTITNDADREPNELIYHQMAGRTVVRYNDFDGSTYTAGDCLFFDTHGNQNYYDTGNDAGEFRGQPIVEVYNNTFTAYDTYRMFNIRGGSMLFWGNTIATDQSTSPMTLQDEETWSTTHFETGLDTTWPVEDQITNTFIWDNTGDLVVNVETNSQSVIRENYEYYLHAPQATGGYEYYTDRMGSAGNASDGTLAHSATGANAYYPYTPYTYPHPLRGEGNSGKFTPSLTGGNLQLSTGNNGMRVTIE